MSQSAAEKAHASAEAAQNVPKSAPSGTQACPTDDVHFAIFFEGTGYKESDNANTYRLYTLCNYAKVYIRGVGSDWYTKYTLGGATGLGGQKRIRNAKKHVQDFFNKTPQARTKNLYLYGWSRGASLARHFANEARKQQIFNTTKVIKERWVGGGIVMKRELIYAPHTHVQVKFLGIFDSVGSFGVPGNNTDLRYDFNVYFNYVKATYHFIAEDEHRNFFELQSIKLNPDMASSPPTGPYLHNPRYEWQYPGSHGDVGGGEKFSVITLRDMYNASVRSGVSMKPNPYTVPGDLQARYEAYVADRAKLSYEDKFVQVKTEYIHALPTGAPYNTVWAKRKGLDSYVALKPYLTPEGNDVRRQIYYAFGGEQRK